MCMYLMCIVSNGVSAKCFHYFLTVVFLPEIALSHVLVETYLYENYRNQCLGNQRAALRYLGISIIMIWSEWSIWNWKYLTVELDKLLLRAKLSLTNFVWDQIQAKLRRWQLLKIIIEKVCVLQFLQRTVMNPLWRNFQKEHLMLLIVSRTLVETRHEWRKH